MQHSIFRLFIGAARNYPWRMYGAIANSTLTSLVGSFAGPLIIAVVLESIQAVDISLQGSLWLIGLFALAQLYGEVIGWRLNIYLAWTFESAAQRDLHNRIFRKLTESSLQFHANRSADCWYRRPTS